MEAAARPWKVPKGSFESLRDTCLEALRDLTRVSRCFGTVLGLEGAARGAARCSKAGQQGGHGPARLG